MKKITLVLITLIIVLTACAPAVTPEPTAVSATETAVPTNTQIPATQTATLAPTLTATLAASQTPTLEPTATSTQTISEKLKTHIVFYLILPQHGKTDACGDITIEPIISQRLRTGDKLQDVQIALNMLFSVSSQYYGAYYNAMWNTNFSINSYTYDKGKDSMEIDFGGYFPVNQISKCDKHGIREQIWKTFYHYGFKEKVFTYNGKFLIDQLSR